MMILVAWPTRHSYWLRWKAAPKTKRVKWKSNEGEDKLFLLRAGPPPPLLLSPFTHRKGSSLLTANWSEGERLDCVGWLGGKFTQKNNCRRELLLVCTDWQIWVHRTTICHSLSPVSHLSPDWGSLLCLFCILIHECSKENTSRVEHNR